MNKSHVPPSCQLYLILEVQAATHDHLAAVLARVPTSTVLFKPVRGAKLAAATVKPLIELTQSKNVAALLLDDVSLARALRVDGIHLSAGPDVVQRFEQARDVLGTGASIGADCGGSRHTAMELGEAGADYVGFGRAVPPPATTDDTEPTVDDLTGPFDQIGLIGWWAQVFEVPCVAFDVDDVSVAAELASAGADFVAVMPPAGTTTAALIEWLTYISLRLERADA